MASSAMQDVVGQIAAGTDSLRQSVDIQPVSMTLHKATKAAGQVLNPGQPSYPWLPEPGVSYMQASGAPKGTPFLGTVANIEEGMRRGWRVADLPGDTSDQKWFHFVYPKTPLRGFEKHPFFTAQSALTEQATATKEETLKSLK